MLIKAFIIELTFDKYAYDYVYLSYV